MCNNVVTYNKERDSIKYSHICGTYYKYGNQAKRAREVRYVYNNCILSRSQFVRDTRAALEIIYIAVRKDRFSALQAPEYFLFTIHFVTYELTRFRHSILVASSLVACSLQGWMMMYKRRLTASQSRCRSAGRNVG